MPESKPKISVITVVFNGVSSIEETVSNVLDQSYENLEYIVIDGGSNDGTQDLIKKYQDKISLWISEPDRGIYDAMNKGIAKASGEYVIFMNCGDKFYDADTVKSFFIKNINRFYNKKLLSNLVFHLLFRSKTQIIPYYLFIFVKF